MDRHHSGGDFDRCPGVIGNSDIFARQIVEDNRLSHIGVADQNDSLYRRLFLSGLLFAGIHSLSFLSKGGLLMNTLTTVAIELHSMIEVLKPLGFGNPVLMGFENLIFEFDYFAAPEADQMIVVASFAGGFIPGLFITEFPPCGLAQAGEKL